MPRIGAPIKSNRGESFSERMSVCIYKRRIKVLRLTPPFLKSDDEFPDF